MAKPLTYVTVHADDGEAVTFSPSDDLPDWAAKKITNPAVLPQEDSGHASKQGSTDKK